MKRLTLAEVAQAFVTTGLTPVNRCWGSGDRTGCVATALWRAAVGKVRTDAWWHCADLWGRDYMRGVIAGWDNCPTRRTVPHNFPAALVIGYEHGALFRRVILEGQPLVIKACEPVEI